MKNIIFIAPPAAGKGTMSSLLKAKYGYMHISTGDLLRDAKNQDNELGRKLVTMLSSGKLVPDEFIMDLVSRQCKDLDNFDGFIIDSAPLSLEQKNVLMKDVEIDVAVYLEIHDYDIVRKRTSLRLVCPNCKYVASVLDNTDGICPRCSAHLERRYDDNPQTVETRIQRFIRETRPVVDALKSEQKLITVNAELSKEAVFNEIIQKLDNFFK